MQLVLLFFVQKVVYFTSINIIVMLLGLLIAVMYYLDKLCIFGEQKSEFKLGC